MHLLLTDETNVTPGTGAEFFACGGLIIHLDRVPDMDRGIADIRDAQGYGSEDDLKFDTRERPSHVTIEQAREAKRQVVELCRRLECKFIAYVILHKIIRGGPEGAVVFGLNTVLWRFNKFLEQNHDWGVVLTDTLPVVSAKSFYQQKFKRGLVLGDKAVTLRNIRLFGSTCIGASHLASAIDIVLGAFRYCISSPRNREAAGTMMVNVVDLMWGEVEGDNLRVLDKGLVLRPKLDAIRHPVYRAKYDDLLRNLAELYRRGSNA